MSSNKNNSSISSISCSSWQLTWKYVIRNIFSVVHLPLLLAAMTNKKTCFSHDEINPWKTDWCGPEWCRKNGNNRDEFVYASFQYDAQRLRYESVKRNREIQRKSVGECFPPLSSQDLFLRVILLKPERIYLQSFWWHWNANCCECRWKHEIKMTSWRLFCRIQVFVIFSRKYSLLWNHFRWRYRMWTQNFGSSLFHSSLRHCQ